MNSYSGIFLHNSLQKCCQIFCQTPLLKSKYVCYIDKALKKQPAGIAQSVEQRTENPRVTSSSLVPGIQINPYILDSVRVFRFLEISASVG